jgi:putative nucleotidyltransferase with HDIG domain
VLDRDEVIARSHSLPSFPRIIAEILATIDDPDGSLKVLVGCIRHDPIIAARVLSVANRASSRARREAEVSDIYTATSLIGMSRVREIALISSLGAFVDKLPLDERSSRLWQHSVCVAVCCQELAFHVAAPVCADSALIAGLLHDIGQFWFYSVDGEAYRHCWSRVAHGAVGIEQAERDQFGVDHSTVGAWLAEHWQLPLNIITAIRCHHVPEPELAAPLVPLVHVAEVLSHALDLTPGDESRVTAISPVACTQLGVVWDESVQLLFGRIEARSRHANAFFNQIPRAPMPSTA